VRLPLQVRELGLWPVAKVYRAAALPERRFGPPNCLARAEWEWQLAPRAGRRLPSPPC